MGEGTGDQKAIMGAICAVKKTSFDGVNCAGEGDETVTGKVRSRRACIVFTDSDVKAPNFSLEINFFIVLTRYEVFYFRVQAMKV